MMGYSAVFPAPAAGEAAMAQAPCNGLCCSLEGAPTCLRPSLGLERQLMQQYGRREGDGPFASMHAG